MSARKPKLHMVKEGSLEPARDGFILARCYCGAKLGVFPDPELAADALMQHAREQGYMEARATYERRTEEP